MKLAVPAHTSHTFHLQLSERAGKLLFSLCVTLLPYAVAAIGVFAYHEQFPR